MPILGEGEFLVLGANPEARLRLDALFEPADEIVAPLDRRHVDLIASHAGVPAKRAATLHAGRQKRKPDARTTDDVRSVVRNPSSGSRRRAFAPGRKAAIKTFALAGHFDEQLRR